MRELTVEQLLGVARRQPARRKVAKIVVTYPALFEHTMSFHMCCSWFLPIWSPFLKNLLSVLRAGRGVTQSPGSRMESVCGVKGPEGFLGRRATTQCTVFQGVSWCHRADSVKEG